MFTYISSHMGDIVVFLILALLVSAIIVRMVKDKKSGNGGCGCGCKGCANSPCCHPQANAPSIDFVSCRGFSSRFDSHSPE